MTGWVPLQLAPARLNVRIYRWEFSATAGHRGSGSEHLVPPVLSSSFHWNTHDRVSWLGPDEFPSFAASTHAQCQPQTRPGQPLPQPRHTSTLLPVYTSARGEGAHAQGRPPDYSPTHLPPSVPPRRPSASVSSVVRYTCLAVLVSCGNHSRVEATAAPTAAPTVSPTLIVTTETYKVISGRTLPNRTHGPCKELANWRTGPIYRNPGIGTQSTNISGSRP